MITGKQSNNQWGNRSTNRNGGGSNIDYFKDTLDFAGWWVVYVRCNLSYPCSCIEHGEPEPFCTDCIGTGYVVSYEKRRVLRGWKGGNLDTADPAILVGEIQSVGTKFYMDEDVRPKQGDMIIECEWNAMTPHIGTHGYPVNLQTAYVITAADVYRERDSVLMFEVGVTQKEANKKWLESVLLDINKLV